MDFYKILTPFYDEMIDFENRIIREKPFFKELITSYKIKSALDIGCGTGMHSIMFSELGVESWGFDNSLEMIKKAKINAKKRNVNAVFKRLSLENWHSNIKRNFNAIFCLGNTLPHILHKNKLKKTIKNVYNGLSTEGIIMVQILNYYPIMKYQKRIVNIKKLGNHTFIRFYDFLNNIINFNILVLTEKDKKLDYKLITTELMLIYKDELIEIIEEVGFKKVKCYGDFEKNRFYKNGSKDVIILAEK